MPAHLALLLFLPRRVHQPFTEAWVVGWWRVKVQVIQLACEAAGQGKV
jgi:hypothetical protein